MSRSGLTPRARRLVRRLRHRGGYAAFRAEVEPRLGVQPRVHRFAQVPIIGQPTTPLAPLAVATLPVQDGAPMPEALASVDAALAGQTLRPADAPDARGWGGLAGPGAEWIVLIRPGDELSPRALERLAQAAVLAPDAGLITCDEDDMDTRGRRRCPHLRPGPSPDRLLATGDVGALIAVRRDRARAHLPRLRARGAGAQLELALRLAGPDGAGHAHVPQILVHARRRDAERDERNDMVATRAALTAWGAGAARVETAAPGVRRVRRAVGGEPAVDVIVLFRDRPELVERAASTLLERSAWERLMLHLVDNGSADPAIGPLLHRLDHDRRVVLHRDPRPFNFAVLNNAAAAGASGDLLVFLNSDTEVRDPDWIETLAEEALRPEVGAVAPLLLYPDGTVQHAGAALGLHGYAGHPFAGLGPDAPTPFGAAAQGTRNWLAVSAACLMVQRRKFEAVGGFDERFVVAGNDVDLCLRLGAQGWRSLCVPHTHLVHDESRSRGTHIDPGDFERSAISYGAFRTVGDPFYHPALTLTRTDCSLRRPDEEPQA